ncbi:MAG: hypothetical protein HYR56_00600 [Acidobacteria bacterium]|nr:hypothetical protein [Acidobacteriota bacterium]MBI3424443.1 hypothetical protein [Acidobacteriota bacterium]
MNSLGNALQSQTAHPDNANRSGDLPVRRDAPDGRNLLARILDTPHLAQVVPQLQPEVLHRVIQHCGLEDCGELVALTTPEQLARVFDHDLWRANQPGQDEQFDAERFGVWIEVLLENGAEVTAQKLAAMDAELVISGLAQHALVYDRAAVTPYETLEGELITFYADAISAFDNGLSFEAGGYLLLAKRADSWEAIVEVLMALGETHPGYFNQVLHGCIRLSNTGFEDDGLDDLLAAGEQVMFDLAGGREGRREKQGYVTPGQARAFLQMARELRLDAAAKPTANPLARAYFRAINETPTTDTNSASSPAGLLAKRSEPAPEQSAESVAAIYELLLDAGVIPQPLRALLAGAVEHLPRLNEIKARLEFALNQNYSAYLARQEELAYLANVLMAGCSIQARPFTAQEASDAALATCNLGLENWPPHWLPANSTALPTSFLVAHDLISVFQVGWKILHDNVGMYAANQLIEVLKRMRCDDREIQRDLDVLRIKLAKHWQAGAPWHARDALEVLAILDTSAWAALLTLIDECPTLHAVVGASRDSRTLSVNASDFEFISENSQIASVREFMRSLPETLCL